MINNITINYLNEEFSAGGFSFFAQFLFLFLFAMVVLLAVCGNSIVIWIVLAHRRMRTPTNYFLVNLAFSDVLNAVFNIPFNGYYMITQVSWPFGSFMCLWVQAVSYISITVNVLTYVAISLERCFAIIHPLRTKLTPKQTIMIICGIWILSLLISSPGIRSFYSAGRMCQVVDIESHQKYEWIFFSVTYVYPIVILTITYTRIAIELWGQTVIGEVTNEQRDSIQSKRKVVKMLIAVVLIFGICWFPQQLYFILVSVCKSMPEWPSTPYVYLISYFFAMSNSMCNPFLYFGMDNRFRNGFRSVFRCCPCVECRTTLGRANSSQQSTATTELSSSLNRHQRQN